MQIYFLFYAIVIFEALLCPDSYIFSITYLAGKYITFWFFSLNFYECLAIFAIKRNLTSLGVKGFSFISKLFYIYEISKISHREGILK